MSRQSNLNVEKSVDYSDAAVSVRHLPTTSALRRRCADDSGASSSMAMVMLTPVMVVMMFLAWQAALWNHARSQARIVAQDTAVLVARSGIDPGTAEHSAAVALESDDDFQRVAVSVTTSNGLVTVTVRAQAPGVVRGTASAISVRAVVAIEDWAQL